MKEIWKDIDEFNGVYKISNVGNIVSFKKNVPKVLNPKPLKNGYKLVHLTYAGVNKKYSIHRLVAITFIPNLENKPCINHKNGIKTDNRVENLEWCTSSENTKHAYFNQLMKTKISRLQINEIKKSYNRNQKELAKKYNVNQSQISRILNNKSQSK